MAGGYRKIDEYNKSISAEERKANASIAGKASGESRNLKARLLEWAENGGYQKMLDMADEEISNGNTKMWELVRDTIGEKPIDRVQITEIDEDIIEEVESVVLEDEESVINNADEKASSRVPKE